MSEVMIPDWAKGHVTDQRRGAAIVAGFKSETLLFVRSDGRQRMVSFTSDRREGGRAAINDDAMYPDDIRALCGLPVE